MLAGAGEIAAKPLTTLLETAIAKTVLRIISCPSNSLMKRQ
jgi:hypothetical protein